MAMIAAATTTIITMGTVTRMASHMVTNMTETPLAILPLSVWLSPAFPVGAFAYSHGLEWAVESGAVHSADTLRDWAHDLLAHGSARNDAVLLAEAWRAGRDPERLQEVHELALALAPSRERLLETKQQGAAFVTAIRAAWPCDTLALFDGDVAYPVALGATAAGHNLPLLATIEHFLLAFAANLISAAVRLGPIGQTDGQRITAALLPVIRETAHFAHHSTLDDLGSATIASDLASMQHETQYSRLFRS
jgi:urease accessory protein